MNVNTDVWGQPQINYDSINQRTGTTDLNDPDYVNFPPFVTCDLTFGASTPPLLSGQSLWVGALIKPQYFHFQSPIDKSIAYCACKNPEILTAQYAVPLYGLYDEPYADMQSPSEAFKLISDGTPTPYIFMSAYPYSNDGTSSITITTTQLYNPYYPSVTQSFTTSLYYPRGTNTAEYDTKAHINNANKNLLVSYWRDFGLRSLFGVIRVAYIDNTYNANTGLPTAPTTSITLKAYENNTEEWKSTHNIVAAWLSIYFRRNIDGTYSSSRPVGQFFGVDCSFQAKASGFDGGEIWQPIMNYYKNANSYLPLFGHTGAGVGTTTNVQYQAAISANASGGTNTTSYMLCGMGSQLEYVKHGKQEDTSSTEGIRTWWCELPYTDTEKLRTAAAAYGLFFADDVYDLADAGRDEDRWTDVNMCLGVVDDEGYTDGTYTRGEGNKTANNFLWRTASESRYDPSRPPPTPDNRYDTRTVFNTIGDLATMTRRYVLRGSEVQQLGSALWSISEALSDSGTDFSELTPKVIDQFLTNNPIDCVISLQRYPMTIPAAGTTTVKLGKTDTGIAAKPMERTAYFYLFAGSTINPKFGDSFLDYNPYTRMELYVPFCGTMQLNPADIIGRQLNVQLAVDFTTGTATGFIMSDDLVIETVNGNIAIDIPVTGIQAATVASQLNNAIANKSNKTLEAQSATLGNISIGGMIRFISDPVRTYKAGEIAVNEETRAIYDLTHQNAPIHIIGAASAVGGWAIDLQCRLIIYYPSGDVIRTGQPPEWNSQQLARYGHTTGFACCIEGSIGSMDTGLVVGTSPDLNGMITNTQGYPATAAELDMLRAAISEGVIL